jgi:hypothetical protein
MQFSPAGALCLAALLALALPAGAAAGELRVLVEADGNVRNDGNYLQRATRSAAQEEDPAGEPARARDSEQTVARAGFRLNLSYATPHSSLALAYNPSYEESLDDKDLSGLTQVLRFGLIANPSRRSTVTLSERLVSSRNFEDATVALQPAADADAIEPIAVTRRGDQLTSAFEAGTALDLTRRTSFLIGASHTLRTFDDDVLVDSQGFGLNGGIRFRTTEQRSWELLAGAERYDFENDRDSEVTWGGLGFSTGILRDGHLHAELGAFRASLREAPRAPVETHDGLRGTLGISYLRELFTWAVGYRHGASPGIGLGRATLVDSAFGGISTLGRRVTFGLAGSASRVRDLSDRNDLGGTGDGRGSVETATGTLRASWSFAAWGRLTAGYSRIWQQADLGPFEDLSYSRYFLGFALRLYDSGERPLDPAELGETRHDEPVAR